ncbi:MAG: glycosyltransferase family 4 protein [Corynebacterium sp.]|nr:glycosyltransferase family 4 protein [Corynebacterium sp.]
MRIGIVCPYSFDEPGGVQAHILDLAHVFISQGHYVRVLGPAAENTKVPEFVHKGGSSIPIKYNGSVARLSMGPHVARAVRDFITAGNFDVLHIHEPNSPSFSLAALRLARGPIVATYHASASHSVALRLARPVLQPLLDKIRGGIAVSEMARRWQVEQLGGDPILIPNGVETALFRAARLAHEVSSAGISCIQLSDASTPPPIRIAFLGRLDEPRKGLGILLKALDLVDRDVEVTVIGGGTPRPHPKVTYVGRVDDERKAEILGASDIYVAPNTGGESFGIVLIEAMAAGCAVIASDLEAFAAVCNIDSAQPAGLMFDNGNAADLAAKITLLVDDAALRETLIDAGVARAEEYDWGQVSAAIMRVYETVNDGTKVTV